jgi:hypothetical protein
MISLSKLSFCILGWEALAKSVKKNLENFPVIHHEEWSEITYY